MATKKLTNYILDLGRAIAFYPGLKKITGSLTSSILLCQLIYWSNKTTDGWIWKTADEIEEETGLTYNEQKTAKIVLKELGILEIKVKRIEHLTYYRLNQTVLNDLWEKTSGKKSEPIVEDEFAQEEKKEKTVENNKDSDDDAEEYFAKRKELFGKSSIDETRRKAKEEGKDLIDAMLDFDKSHGSKMMKEKIAIKEEVEKRLHIIARDKRWDAFVDFVYIRQNKHNEPVSKFIDWAMMNGFDPIYWTPEKMKTLYPQAFIQSDPEKIKEEFIKPKSSIKKIDDKEETEESIPMPDFVKRKKYTDYQGE